MATTLRPTRKLFLVIVFLLIFLCCVLAAGAINPLARGTGEEGYKPLLPPCSHSSGTGGFSENNPPAGTLDLNTGTCSGVPYDC